MDSTSRETFSSWETVETNLGSSYSILSRFCLTISSATCCSLKKTATARNRMTGHKIGKMGSRGKIKSAISPAFTQALAI